MLLFLPLLLSSMDFQFMVWHHQCGQFFPPPHPLTTLSLTRPQGCFHSDPKSSYCQNSFPGGEVSRVFPASYAPNGKPRQNSAKVHSEEPMTLLGFLTEHS